MASFFEPIPHISFVAFYLWISTLNLLPIASAATPKNADRQVICQAKKLGHDEALFLYLRKPQGEFEDGGAINLYEDAKLQVLAKGIQNWIYVSVIDADSPKEKGLEGWMRSSSLKCSGNVAQVQPALCEVTGLQSGQLALRATAGGKSTTGLDNGNNITLLKPDIVSLQGRPTPWVEVRVTNSPNNRILGREGWINSEYILCYSQENNDAINYP
ncbi:MULTISPECIES: hypothetical protein [unclassified Nostoc]|uniref:hypothetical protein n=1 Tax=unclassified Nostoc TaxID=2593658 RepID=UPI0025AAF7B7|nr:MULTISPECIES: hypothetical protein [unclassified Nostoc]MDM9581778.1 hypothetical protein [Nostoc sp. GT001]MDZ7946903.1 hypothetical protein [Nostoc sp. EfeVER01]MDZ7995680.1 hypothetical protein [Nostoc sp. EspVER01]